MTDDLRRTVAYIAGRLVSGARSSAVYDYATGSYFQISGSVSDNHVSIYDYGRGCHVGGSTPSLYDYGNASFFEVKKHGSKVKGYDYASSTFYEATVNGRNVSVYDYGAGSFFSYSL